MGGDPTSSESVAARRAAGVRGDRRGRGWGSILSDCSYSRADRGGCGGGVGSHGGVPRQLTTVSCVRVFCVLLYRLSLNAESLSCLGIFLSSLIGEMEGKEHEHEEN